jgi:hypothetical protein
MHADNYDHHCSRRCKEYCRPNGVAVGAVFLLFDVMLMFFFPVT